MISEVTFEAFLNYVEQTKGSNTSRMYCLSIEKFSEWYGKTPNEILKARAL